MFYFYYKITVINVIRWYGSLLQLLLLGGSAGGEPCRRRRRDTASVFISGGYCLHRVSQAPARSFKTWLGPISRDMFQVQSLETREKSHGRYNAMVDITIAKLENTNDKDKNGIDQSAQGKAVQHRSEPMQETIHASHMYIIIVVLTSPKAPQCPVDIETHHHHSISVQWVRQVNRALGRVRTQRLWGHPRDNNDIAVTQE